MRRHAMSLLELLLAILLMSLACAAGGGALVRLLHRERYESHCMRLLQQCRLCQRLAQTYRQRIVLHLSCDTTGLQSAIEADGPLPARVTRVCAKTLSAIASISVDGCPSPDARLIFAGAIGAQTVQDVAIASAFSHLPAKHLRITAHTVDYVEAGDLFVDRPPAFFTLPPDVHDEDPSPQESV